MVQYTLTLKLDNAILTSGATDKLVIAKKVNGVLSTVFAGASPVPANGFKQLQSSNVFQWEDKYKVFGTATFGKGIMVSATTNVVDIDVGQFAEYKGNVFQDAVKQGKEFFDLESSFAIDGVPTAYHIGVKMSVGGSDYVTIFVDPNIHVTIEKMELQPQNEYYLFWKNEVRTEAMYALNSDKGSKFSFKAGETQKTLRFGFATADSPVNPLEVPAWY
ncbi:hypothetical protein BGZ57DRAFT_922395 [Hyaloscypha finlandica]|nr:hypothetical protein BGZ57DRAFT_922395 [Hyaloscypha finlandica]KAH8803800.1 hypothetical protein F5882DRAFT_499535 [Hyaloscypha sp. PMI_1271]